LGPKNSLKSRQRLFDQCDELNNFPPPRRLVILYLNPSQKTLDLHRIIPGKGSSKALFYIKNRGTSKSGDPSFFFLKAEKAVCGTNLRPALPAIASIRYSRHPPTVDLMQ
jgi:hypothetical protein